VDTERDEIDRLIVRYMCGKDQGYDAPVAAGSVSLSRFLEVQADRAGEL
jgi:hypothetical protein